jgi:hypothetical protein
MPPNGIGTLTLPATKNRGLAGEGLSDKSYKNRGFASLITLPATKTRGLRQQNRYRNQEKPETP